MSETYYLSIEVMSFVMRVIWSVILCLMYRHFFRLRFRPGSRWMIFLPGVLWFAVKQILDVFIVVSLATPAESMKSLFKQLLVYGILLLFSFLFYQGSRKQLFLVTMLFAAVSETGRFLSFSLSVFWSKAMDLSNQWFERNYTTVALEDYMSLIELLAFLQQLSYTLIFLAVIYGTFRYVRRIFKNRELPVHRTEFLFLLFPCASSFLLCTLLRTIMFTFNTGDVMPKTLFEAFPLLIGIVPLLLVLCLFSVLYSMKLYQEMLTLNEERNRRAVLEKQVVSMEEHARELERIYSGVRSMKHDMKNQLAVLENLIGRRDGGEEIPGYLEQLGRTLGKLDIPFQTGSTVVDSLLFMKYHEACEKLPGICFEAESLIFPKECRIQPTDLCIILGNALDNAIEACERPGAGASGCFIRLSSRSRQDMFLLTVENSFNGELKISRGSAFPATTKADGEAHGIGMHNIRTAAERYRGGVSWEAEKNKFVLTVMLNNSL
ncbi:MAG: GHKL domain-containing protein [Lachnospiraceae bacterium]|nr:GHKL domain-containing protein [Lachnospiraceae bacterium]MCM1238738.1 GHKL domain-containing protein [Lachnospiraceae bacterium]